MKIEKNKSLSSLCTFSIGDKVKFFTEVSNEKELNKAINWAENKNMSYKICADASNIVFPDSTMDEFLIKISGGNIKKFNELILVVDAGVSLEKAISKANRLGLKGLETLAGIPGTLGGAIVGNAGTYGKSISESVESVLIWKNGKKNGFQKTNVNLATEKAF